MIAPHLRTTLSLVSHGLPLDRVAAQRAFDALADRDVSPAWKGAVLGALVARGESGREFAEFARAMLERAKGPVLHSSPVLVDTCGTGGDGSGSFNLSTAAALLLAAEGIPVAKHGNRSVSSPCGSADLIEALGIEFASDPLQAAREIQADGFSFLYARAFHPATAGISSVRQQLGVRTIFNILGPLVNPARPTHQLTGTGDRATASHMAEALSLLDVERAFVVTGAEGWDEATQVGPFQLFDVCTGRVTSRTITPESFGIERCSAGELAGGDAQRNAHLLRAVFDPGGEDRDPIRDAVLLNAALCLLLVDEEHSPTEAVARLRTTIDEGRAAAFLQRISNPDREQQL